MGIYSNYNGHKNKLSLQDFLNQDENMSRLSFKSSTQNKKKKNKNTTCVRNKFNKILLQ